MTIGEVSIVLGFAAGAMQLIGYWVYVQKMETPNTMAWAMWTLGAGVELWSYAEMTGDWVKNILPTACALACVVVFIIALWRRKFNWPETYEIRLFNLDCAITAIWLLGVLPAVGANLLYQGTTILSFIPMARGISSGKEKEHGWPWALWTVAYLLFLISVALRLQSWEELVYPVVAVVCHFLVMMLALKQKLKGPSQ